MTEAVNTPDVAQYLLTVYPLTEHKVRKQLEETVKKDYEKCVVAEVDGDPAGYVGLHLEQGRTRHIGWLGIWVRRQYWGQGVGTALMEKFIHMAKAHGCRKLMLDAFEGNERALKLYRKIGFKIESKVVKRSYIDGKWRNGIVMSLELASLEPRIDSPPKQKIAPKVEKELSEFKVRQLMNMDLDELNKLQNCVESTKSSTRIPPVSKEKTKEWYESLNTQLGKFCFGCFKSKRMLGYLQFNAAPPPFIFIDVREFIVDIKESPVTVANLLVKALIDFKKRYIYRQITCEIPITSTILAQALEQNGFIKTGTWKGYYFIDGYYVDAVSYLHS